MSKRKHHQTQLKETFKELLVHQDFALGRVSQGEGQTNNKKNDKEDNNKGSDYSHYQINMNAWQERKDAKKKNKELGDSIDDFIEVGSRNQMKGSDKGKGQTFLTAGKD